jgi:hypothetical protein
MILSIHTPVRPIHTSVLTQYRLPARRLCDRTLDSTMRPLYLVAAARSTGARICKCGSTTCLAARRPTSRCPPTRRSWLPASSCWAALSSARRRRRRRSHRPRRARLGHSTRGGEGAASLAAGSGGRAPGADERTGFFGAPTRKETPEGEAPQGGAAPAPVSL